MNNQGGAFPKRKFHPLYSQLHPQTWPRCAGPPTDRHGLWHSSRWGAVIRHITGLRLAVVTVQSFALGKRDLVTDLTREDNICQCDRLCPRWIASGNLNPSGACLCQENNEISLDSYPKAAPGCDVIRNSCCMQRSIMRKLECSIMNFNDESWTRMLNRQLEWRIVNLNVESWQLECWIVNFNVESWTWMSKCWLLNVELQNWMLNCKVECWIVNLNFGGDITPYTESRS